MRQSDTKNNLDNGTSWWQITRVPVVHKGSGNKKINLCMGLCPTATTLTKLYPGPNGPHWNTVDSLQVVLHVTLGHSAMKTREFVVY